MRADQARIMSGVGLAVGVGIHFAASTWPTATAWCCYLVGLATAYLARRLASRREAP